MLRYLREKELCVELVDGLDVAEDGGEGVTVQSEGFVVTVDSAVEDLGGIKKGLHLEGGKWEIKASATNP